MEVKFKTQKQNSTERELKIRGRSKLSHKKSRMFKLLEWLKFTIPPHPLANWDSFYRLGRVKSLSNTEATQLV